MPACIIIREQILRNNRFSVRARKSARVKTGHVQVSPISVTIGAYGPPTGIEAKGALGPKDPRTRGPWGPRTLRPQTKGPKELSEQECHHDDNSLIKPSRCRVVI